jgi:hypothetical protein
LKNPQNRFQTCKQNQKLSKKKNGEPELKERKQKANPGELKKKITGKEFRRFEKRWKTLRETVKMREKRGREWVSKKRTVFL